MLTLPVSQPPQDRASCHLSCPGAEQLSWCHMTFDPFCYVSMLWHSCVIFVLCLSAFGKLFVSVFDF